MQADFAVGRDVLRRAAVPVLGVCLGMQGMVDAYGGKVDGVEPAHGEVARIEHTGAGVFAGLPQDFAAVRYHSLAALVAARRPGRDGARDAADGVVMGVRHGRCRWRACSSTPSRS